MSLTRGEQAITEARRQSEHGPRIDKWLGEDTAAGWCLKAVRTCYGVPALHHSAASAWKHAIIRHPNSAPPRGVPVYWTGGAGGFGHVAISTGDGFIWSTDSRRPGYFDRVPLGAPVKDWGLTYAGWSPYLNGVRVYLDPWAKAPEAKRVDRALTRAIGDASTATLKSLYRGLRRTLRKGTR